LARSFSSKFLGFFDDEHEAAEAYAATARELGREPKKQNKKNNWYRNTLLRLALYLP